MNLKRLSKISDNICIRCSAHLDYDQEVYDRNPEMRCKCKDNKPFTGKDALWTISSPSEFGDIPVQKNNRKYLSAGLR